jgi:hypothetical protein
MRKIFFVLIIGLLQDTVCYAQSASATWQSPADTTTTAAVVTGSITAPVQKLSTTGDTLTTLTVKDYLGGTTTATSTVGVAQRLWLNGHFWPNETAQQIGRYIQYSVSPQPKNKFTVTSITLNIGELGSSNKFFANLYYSTDSTFTTKTQLNAAQLTLSDASSVSGLTTLSYSPAFVVDTGKTFYVRIFPWYNASSTTPTKYVLLTNVIISGTTALAGAPSLIVMPSSLSFGTVKVNTTKDLSITINGTYLTPVKDSIHIVAPAGIAVSAIPGSGYSSTLVLPYSNSTLNLDTVFVRFMPAAAQPYTGNITISGGGVPLQTVNVTGNAVPANTILGIFVAPNGNDADSGTYGHPFLTIQKAVSAAQPGDTIFVRAGTYANTTTISLSQNGTASKRLCLIAYPPDGTRPLLDFSAMSFSGSNRGINLIGNYWYIKGLDIYKAGDNGMYTSGSYNIIEFCVFRENRDGGCQVGGGASYNQYINCDSYYNFDNTGDTTTAGGNADGFAPKMDVGTGNYFYGCRSWQNSDDGWDGYMRPSDDITTTIENCWSFMNGYLKDGVTSYPTMNGNGFKMGGSDATPHTLRHNMIVKNCLSFLNKAKGFDQNNNVGSMTLLNCTAYKNGIGTSGGAYNFSTPLTLASGKILTVENCISFIYTKSPGYTFGTQTSPVFATDSWLSPFTGGATADFISIDTTGVRGPRKADGSLPDITFMHLARGSQFIDAGTNVGLPFNGSAPDLGCFESNYPTSVASERDRRIEGFQLLQNYPNPFNPATSITYQLATGGLVTLAIYDVLGREVVTLVNQVKPTGTYTAVWNADRMPSGMYFSRLKSNGEQQIRKMILMK